MFSHDRCWGKMSVEPGRSRAYSPDVRWRIVWQRIGRNLHYRDISSNLGVSLGTVSNIMRIFFNTGTVDPKDPPSRAELRVLDDHHKLYILGLLYVNPALQLQEICHRIEQITSVVVTPPTIFRLLKQNGMTRKKIRQVALQRCYWKRAKFMANVSFYFVEQFVWVDETGCNDHTRKFGYALKGETPEYYRFHAHGRRVSSVAAMSVDGVLAYELTYNTVNGEFFLDFLRASLVPEMMTYNGSNPKCIIIMDNCSVHHVHSVLDYLNTVGIVVIFFTTL